MKKIFIIGAVVMVLGLTLVVLQFSRPIPRASSPEQTTRLAAPAAVTPPTPEPAPAAPTAPAATEPKFDTNDYLDQALLDLEQVE